MAYRRHEKRRAVLFGPEGHGVARLGFSGGLHIAGQMIYIVRYPPEEGWGEERRHTIETLKVSAGVFPDAKGRRFLEIFPDWVKALRLRESKTTQLPKLPTPAPVKDN